MKDPSKNIITIEDPVEYKLTGVNQVQVKPEIGLTFANALRSFLRLDPDIMLVGEIRDLETAEICVRAALTGHLVLSTLHTNDAPSAVNRLVDIGIEPYLLTPSLLCIVAQRLIRKLCPDCKEAHEPTAEQLGKIKLNAELIYKAKGCSSCNNIGYRGRMCISEVMIITDNIRELVNQRASFMKVREAAQAGGMQALSDSALKKVELGLTSLGPRYCPSVEDKVVRFPDRDRHQVFVEPEGLDTPWTYLGGLSMSLPAEVQERVVRSLPGLERAEMRTAFDGGEMITILSRINVVLGKRLTRVTLDDLKAQED